MARFGMGRASLVRSSAGVAVAVGLSAALTAVMVPLRAHLGEATAGLVMVVPVVVGVTVGGFVAGVVSTLVGFLVYDFYFIPPYGTFSVGAARNWTALVVYAVVTVVVARVVSHQDHARADAQDRAAELRRMLDLSELLVRETTVEDLVEMIVATVSDAFRLDGAALLMPVNGRLEVVASSGQGLTDAEQRRLAADTLGPVAMESASVRRGALQAVALTASGRAVALLALRGLAATEDEHDLLRAFANQLALALERAQLREQALRAQLLEEVDRLRRSLMGAVSHDLRTPLATIKVSASSLLDAEAPVSDADARELVQLIDAQADRLDRLVSNLLDMTRIQSGALELRRLPISVRDLVDESLGGLAADERDRVAVCLPEDLPAVDVDHVLIGQVLVNVIDNALRHGPVETPVVVRACERPGGLVEVSVTDAGPGVPADERTSIFQLFNRREAGGRGGLGLAIAQVFLDVHGQRIWVEDVADGGARFVFGLPVASTEAELPALSERTEG